MKRMLVIYDIQISNRARLTAQIVQDEGVQFNVIPVGSDIGGVTVPADVAGVLLTMSKAGMVEYDD